MVPTLILDPTAALEVAPRTVAICAPRGSRYRADPYCRHMMRIGRSHAGGVLVVASAQGSVPPASGQAHSLVAVLKARMAACAGVPGARFTAA